MYPLRDNTYLLTSAGDSGGGRCRACHPNGFPFSISPGKERSCVYTQTGSRVLSLLQKAEVQPLPTGIILPLSSAQSVIPEAAASARQATRPGAGTAIAASHPAPTG